MSYPPILMKTTDAAAYLGISEATLRSLSIPRKVRGGNRLYYRPDLDEYARELEYETREDGKGENECDKLFGIQG